MPAFAIAAEDPATPDIAALIGQHLAEMHACSPACKVHAMPAARLAQTDVTFYAARVDGALAAVGALKALDATAGEIKSMRAADEWRGTGAGPAILAHILREARARGYRWVGLETGRHPVFGPAQRLYAAHGFRECAPFAGYVSDDFSLCMGLPLA
ncbi:GNAT family N-acetyltransferase [Erythrobacter arachoides]|uniref:GNAT family N-acetyltransferase n=1 Tax=Aurantiacibacter arachoides TaxID=1850444 RepID=A0A844ZYG2_9SPHN|nr:GNAT family N-acetyltransferase [Aurantiacibacter arachoides]MXO92260.1 GNAT family N-acetyltransferase [Aurantiacibacter arachoides]GGD58459.1 N-acetyltransferase [Aurantiacibacter arachoides]